MRNTSIRQVMLHGIVNNVAYMKDCINRQAGCFVAGTLVHAREGLKPIQDIKVGDYVLSVPASGEGEAEYKQVVRTVKSEEQPIWFISWEAEYLHEERVAKNITFDQYVEAHGNGFVLTTPNHPFWVVESDEDYLICGGAPELYKFPPFPKSEWVRADKLALGMKIRLVNGRIATIIRSLPVYKTDENEKAWVNILDHEDGLLIDLANREINPNTQLPGILKKKNTYALLMPNPNIDYQDDHPLGSNKNSWFKTMAYNFEVEGFHTYFVDRLGVLVHGAICHDVTLDKVQIE